MAKSLPESDTGLRGAKVSKPFTVLAIIQQALKSLVAWGEEHHHKRAEELIDPSVPQNDQPSLRLGRTAKTK
jgi:hypothetical protein